MPELPDVTVYVEHVAKRTVGDPLARVRLASPFVLRSVDPPVSAVSGKKVTGVSRLGKRIVLELEDELFVVIHLMISGRFKWLDPGAMIPKKVGLAAFDFARGTLLLTEASTKKRASIHVVKGKAALAALDPGGIEVMTCDLAAFKAALVRENHTLKRTLTDPRVFSGIGNAYSDEILHRAKLSPARLSQKLEDADVKRLFEATRTVLAEFTEHLREESKDEFPTKVTAFREEMAVHGKYGKPCPTCGARVMRIVYAENEANYCPTCQTEGKLLADRALSRLLGKDWPRSLEELEAMKRDRQEDVKVVVLEPETKKKKKG
jgi:formamidopyrimidine-DNA glycosylase